MRGRNLFESLRNFTKEELPKRHSTPGEQLIAHQLAELLRLIEMTPRVQSIPRDEWAKLLDENRRLQDTLDLLSHERAADLETARRYHRIKDEKQKRLKTARKLMSQVDQNTELPARLRSNLQQWLDKEDV